MRKFTIIAVAGMHRSGTSLAANVIQSFGVPMGTGLLPANEYNKWGYFEDTKVVEIHDQLLTDLMRPWGSVRHTFPLPENWMTTKHAKSARTALEKYLRAEISANKAAGIWAVKDPRLSLFLPLWQEVVASLGARLEMVLCVRSVEAVAASLLSRDKFPLNAGRLMWLQYNALAIDAAKVGNTQILWFEDWQARPKDVLEKLRKLTGAETKDDVSFQFEPTGVHQKARKSFGLFAEWEDAFKDVSTSSKVGKRLKALAQTYLNHSQTTRIWMQFWDDKKTQKDMSWRLEKDLQVYRSAHDKLAADSKKQVLKAQEDLKRVEKNADGLASAYMVVQAERDDAVHNARENLAAYQSVDAKIADLQSHADALGHAYEVVQNERDAQARAAQDNLAAYKAIDVKLVDLQEHADSLASAYEVVQAERDDAVHNARENLAAYQSVDAKIADLQSHADALGHAYEVVQNEWDAQARAAQDNLAAYKAIDVKLVDLQEHADSLASAYEVVQAERDDAVHNARENLAAHQSVDAKIADLQSHADALGHAYEVVQNERDAQARAAQDNLAAYKAIDVKLADLQEHADSLASAYEVVQAERDDAVHNARENLAAHQSVDAKIADLQSHADALGHAYEVVQNERDAQARAAQDNLAAYKAIDVKLADLQEHADSLASAYEVVQAERDDAVHNARENLTAYQSVDAKIADLQSHADALGHAYEVVQNERDAQARAAQDNLAALHAATDEAARLKRWHLPSMTRYVFTGFGLFSKKR